MNNLESTFFPVSLEMVYHPGANDITGWEDTKYRYVMRNDTNEILSIVTKDYQLVENEKLVEAIMPSIDSFGGKLIECKLFGDGSRVQYRFQFPDKKITILDQDDLIPEVVIKNSYDGSTAITVMAGAFRLVCTNGMVIGQIVDYFRNRHLTDVDVSKLNDIIQSTIEKTITYLNEKVVKLAEIKPVKEQHIIDVIQLFPERMMERAMEHIIRNKPKNYWDLLNITTNIATHNMNREAESTHKLEQKFLPAIMKMAKLK